MAWRICRIESKDTRSEDITDEELLAIYWMLRDYSKPPYDTTNPRFSAYLKISDLVPKER